MKKRNPQDATFRNINALKKRITDIEKALVSVIALALAQELQLHGVVMPTRFAAGELGAKFTGVKSKKKTRSKKKC